MTALPTTVSALLRAARGELDRRGWSQDEYETSTGEVCLLGALRAAMGGQPSEDPGEPDRKQMLRAAADALIQRTGVDVVATDEYPYFTADLVASWNDADGRTLEQVVALLDTTASALNAAAQNAPTQGSAA